MVAVSGGKDSTAMALRLNEVEPNPKRIYLITPTGDELPEMKAHWEQLECILGAKLTVVNGPTLQETITKENCLPNWRARFCTRIIKIEPTIKFLETLPQPVVQCVGIRADEPKREGLYSDQVENRFPLREWGWGKSDVLGYLKSKQVRIPKRTDCARCFYQRLSEWFDLWWEHRDLYESIAKQERERGHSFRSPGRDIWPAFLDELADEFRRHRIPRGAITQLDMYPDEYPDEESCRICRM